MWFDIHEFSYLNRKKVEGKLTRENLTKRFDWYWNMNDPFYKDGDKDFESFYEFAERIHNLIIKINKLEGSNHIFTHGHVIRLMKILFKHFSSKTFERSRRNPKFYKELMNTFWKFYDDGIERHTKNAEVLDFTEQVEKYCR